MRAGALVSTATLELAREIAAAVTDPELPMLTLDDLGILRGVEFDDSGGLVVWITPTYSGCPAMATMRDDLVRTLQQSGFPQVSVNVSLHPAWTTDWISDHAKDVMSRHGISPPGSAPPRTMLLSLLPTRRAVRCPRCASDDVSLTSEFGSTACKAMYRCRACLEPFDHLKEI